MPTRPTHLFSKRRMSAKNLSSSSKYILNMWCFRMPGSLGRLEIHTSFRGSSTGDFTSMVLGITHGKILHLSYYVVHISEGSISYSVKDKFLKAA